MLVDITERGREYLDTKLTYALGSEKSESEAFDFITLDTLVEYGPLDTKYLGGGTETRPAVRRLFEAGYIEEIR